MTAPTPSRAFDPAVDNGSSTPGPNWSVGGTQASLERIRSAPTVDAAIAQAGTEQVVLLHSIRRLLIWTLVVVPVLAVALGITLIVVTPGTPDCGTYGTLCR